MNAVVHIETAFQTSEKKQKYSGKGRPQIQCWYCDKKGHVKVKCQEWLKDTDEGRQYAIKHPESRNAKTGPLPTPGSKGNLSSERAQLAMEFAGETCWEAAESLQGPGTWVIDSGATSHMTPNRSAYFEYSTVRPRTVNAANGSEMQVIGLGKIRLFVDVEGRMRSIVLTDVLHIPQIRGNLISVPKLQDKGMVVETTIPPAEKALIVKYQGQKVGIANRVDNAFVLNMARDSAFPAQEITDLNRPTEIIGEEYTRWHRRFGHIGSQIIGKLHMAVDDIPGPIEPARGQPSCEVCLLTKKIRVQNRIAPERSLRPLARVFSDFWGPYRVPAITGEEYMLTFTDDYTRKSWVTLTRNRRELPFVFAKWRAFVELQSNHKLLALRSDNAQEYKSLGDSTLTPDGIAVELTTVYTPEQNGVSERLNRSLITMARSMLLKAKLPARFWGYAVIAACYLRNRMAIGPEDKTPEEAFTGRKPSTTHLRTFGCIAYAHIPAVTRAKLDPVARKTIFVGYLPTSK